MSHYANLPHSLFEFQNHCCKNFEAEIDKDFKNTLEANPKTFSGVVLLPVLNIALDYRGIKRLSKCLNALSSQQPQQLPTAGLEKYLNSTLSVGQVTLKFCLPGALPHLPKFSNSLIIHKSKNGSQQVCFKTHLDCSPLSADHFHVYAIVLLVILPQLLTSSFRFYKVVRFVMINMDEHCYNHIEVVCTLHCQIIYSVTILSFLTDCFHMPCGTLMFLFHKLTSIREAE